MKAHLLARITVPGRFTQAALETLLSEANLLDRSYNTYDNIRKVSQKAEVSFLKNFLQ
jgi:hypothetical protein